MKTTIEEINDEIYEGLLEDIRERQAFEMAVKAHEETEIKPPCGVKELLAERKRTNQQMLATISAEEFYDKIMWLLHDYGKRYQNSRLSITEWLESEVEDEQTER